MKALSDKKIVDCWKKSVSPWTKAIHNKQIESRELATNQAIIKAASSFSCEKILDIGCGEGWLARELSDQGFSLTGIDAIKGFIDTAKKYGGGDFHVLQYENMPPMTLSDKYDIAVCNFSLLGKESVAHVFNIIPKILNNGGRFIIQTLHPHMSCGDSPYLNGWRKGSWSGFSDEFVDPAPWYFRTLESWLDLYISNGLKLDKIEEPINPETGKVASLLMIGSVAS